MLRGVKLLFLAVGLSLLGSLVAVSASQAEHGTNTDSPTAVWQQGVVGSEVGTHTTYWQCPTTDALCIARLTAKFGEPNQNGLARPFCEIGWRLRDPNNTDEASKLWVLPAGDCGHRHGGNTYQGHLDAPLPKLICTGGGAWLAEKIQNRRGDTSTRPFDFSADNVELSPPTYDYTLLNGHGKGLAHNSVGVLNEFGNLDSPFLPIKGHSCGEWVDTATTTTTTPSTTSTTTTTTAPPLPTDTSCNHTAAGRDFGDKDYFVTIVNTRLEGDEGETLSVEARLWRRDSAVDWNADSARWKTRWIGSNAYNLYGLSPTAEGQGYATPSPSTDFGANVLGKSSAFSNVYPARNNQNFTWVNADGEIGSTGCLFRDALYYDTHLWKNSEGDNGSDETFYFQLIEGANYGGQVANTAIGDSTATITIKDIPTTPPHTTTTTTPQTITTVPPPICPTYDYYDSAGILSEQQARADDWQGPRPQRGDGCDTGEYEFEIPPIKTLRTDNIVGFGNTCVDYRAVSDGYIVSDLGGAARRLPITSNDYVALVNGSTTQRIAIDLTIDRQPSEGVARLVSNRIDYTPHAWASGQDELVYSIRERGNSVGCRSVARVQLTFAAKPPTAAGYGIVRIPYTNNDQAETGETKGLRAAYYRPDGVKDPHTYQLRHEAVAHFNVWDKTTWRCQRDARVIVGDVDYRGWRYPAISHSYAHNITPSYANTTSAKVFSRTYTPGYDQHNSAGSTAPHRSYQYWVTTRPHTEMLTERHKHNEPAHADTETRTRQVTLRTCGQVHPGQFGHAPDDDKAHCGTSNGHGALGTETYQVEVHVFRTHAHPKSHTHSPINSAGAYDQGSFSPDPHAYTGSGRRLSASQSPIQVTPHDREPFTSTFTSTDPAKRRYECGSTNGGISWEYVLGINGESGRTSTSGKNLRNSGGGTQYIVLPDQPGFTKPSHPTDAKNIGNVSINPNNRVSQRYPDRVSEHYDTAGSGRVDYWAEHYSLIWGLWTDGDTAPGAQASDRERPYWHAWGNVRFPLPRSDTPPIDDEGDNNHPAPANAPFWVTDDIYGGSSVRYLLLDDRGIAELTPEKPQTALGLPNPTAGEQQPYIQASEQSTNINHTPKGNYYVT